MEEAYFSVVTSSSIMRGGKAWFAIEAKSFDICVEEVGKRLKGCVRYRSKGFTMWVKFGDYSLKCLLNGIEECERAYNNGDWSIAWEEEGRKYRTFLLCSMRDIGRKSFSIAVPKGRGILGGWRLLLGKLRNLGVEPKTEKPSRTSIGGMTKELRRSKIGIKSFMEVLKTEIVSHEAKMRTEAEENEGGNWIIARWADGEVALIPLKIWRL